MDVSRSLPKVSVSDPSRPPTSAHWQKETNWLRFQSWKCPECQVDSRGWGWTLGESKPRWDTTAEKTLRKSQSNTRLSKIQNSTTALISHRCECMTEICKNNTKRFFCPSGKVWRPLNVMRENKCLIKRPLPTGPLSFFNDISLWSLKMSPMTRQQQILTPRLKLNKQSNAPFEQRNRQNVVQSGITHGPICLLL